MRTTYQQAGVDPGKKAKNIAEFSRYQKTRPTDPNLLAGIGPFAACYALKPLLNSYQDPVLVTSCDGVGTKVKLALEWGHLGGLGHDLLGMNVNDLLCVGAKPFLFLDYYASGKLDSTAFLEVLKSIQEACEMAQCSLAGGETAEMPGVYQNNDFDLAGFVVGVVERERMLGSNKVKVGNALLALESSGFHSNGYSLIRRIISQEKLSGKAPSPVVGKTWAELLLEPTRIYAAALRDVIGNCNAAAHITGGGLFENLPRVLPEGLGAMISAKLWAIPEPFLWMQEKAGLSTKELLSIFNCGVGMILICDKTAALSLKQHLAIHQVRAWEIGEIKKQEEKVAFV